MSRHGVARWHGRCRTARDALDVRKCVALRSVRLLCNLLESKSCLKASEICCEERMTSVQWMPNTSAVVDQSQGRERQRDVSVQSARARGSPHHNQDAGQCGSESLFCRQHPPAQAHQTCTPQTMQCRPVPEGRHIRVCAGGRSSPPSENYAAALRLLRSETKCLLRLILSQSLRHCRRCRCCHR